VATHTKTPNPCRARRTPAFATTSGTEVLIGHTLRRR